MINISSDTVYLVNTWLIGFGLLGFLLASLKSGCYWALRQGARNHWIPYATLMSAVLGPFGLFCVLVVPFPHYTYEPMPDIDTNFIKGARWWALFNQIAYCSDYAKALVWLLNPGIPEDFGFHTEAEHPIGHRQPYSQWLEEWRINLKRLILMREMERQYVLDRFWTNFSWAMRNPLGFVIIIGMASPIPLDALKGFHGCLILLHRIQHGGIFHFSP